MLRKDKNTTLIKKQQNKEHKWIWDLNFKEQKRVSYIKQKQFRRISSCQNQNMTSKHEI